MKTVLAAVCAASCLAACASPYVGKPFDSASNNVHSIAMAGDVMPKKAVAFEVASMGSNFGLVGALVDAGIQLNRQDAVNHALSADGFDAEARLRTKLISDLDAKGYNVQALDTGVRTNRDFAPKYPAAHEPVDAYLDLVVVDYGYLSAGAFKPFRPTLAAKVRLVSAKDTTKTLMENMIVYNAIGPANGAITISPNPSYAFKDRADMLADPKRLEAGLDDAFGQVADTVAQLLR